MARHMKDMYRIYNRIVAIDETIITMPRFMRRLRKSFEGFNISFDAFLASKLSDDQIKYPAFFRQVKQCDYYVGAKSSKNDNVDNVNDSTALFTKTSTGIGKETTMTVTYDEASKPKYCCFCGKSGIHALNPMSCYSRRGNKRMSDGTIC